MSSNQHLQDLEVIGLLPAGGQASRISPLPASKELFPIGFRTQKDGSVRPKIVTHYLLEKMRLAGIRKAFVLLRSGKWDIPAYLGDGNELVDMDLGYLIVPHLYGVHYTLNQAYPFVKNAVCALGYPDILFQPEDTYKRLLTRFYSSSADVVINAVPFENPLKGGMIKFDTDGCVSEIIEKPPQTTSNYSWCAAIWKPTFTEYLHEFVAKAEAEAQKTGQHREFAIGDTIHAAIADGLRVEAELIEEGGYLDIGTPDDLIKAVRHFGQQEISTD
jgi:glucose-1-phosphate thymidylyltransferase